MVSNWQKWCALLLGAFLLSCRSEECKDDNWYWCDRFVECGIFAEKDRGACEQLLATLEKDEKVDNTKCLVLNSRIGHVTCDEANNFILDLIFTGKLP